MSKAAEVINIIDNIIDEMSLNRFRLKFGKYKISSDQIHNITKRTYGVLIKLQNDGTDSYLDIQTRLSADDIKNIDSNIKEIVSIVRSN